MPYYLTKDEVFQKQIQREFPECSKCSFLEKRGDNEVYCFYRCKEECLLRKEK